MATTRLSFARGITLDGMQPGLIPAIEYTSALMQYATGGTVQSYDGRLALVVNGGIKPTITSGYRSIQKQAELYAARESNPYPVNAPGESSHNYGLGWDSDVPDQFHPLWRQVREFVGWRVPDNDVVHAEVPDWRRLVGKA